MTTYSCIEKCYCGQVHRFDQVESKYKSYIAPGKLQSLPHANYHPVFVRYIKCERCLKIFFNTKQAFWNNGEVVESKNLYEDDPTCCEECLPIVQKRRLEIYDGITPGTADILARLERIEKELQETLKSLQYSQILAKLDVLSEKCDALERLVE